MLRPKTAIDDSTDIGFDASSQNLTIKLLNSFLSSISLRYFPLNLLVTFLYDSIQFWSLLFSLFSIKSQVRPSHNLYYVERTPTLNLSISGQFLHRFNSSRINEISFKLQSSLV